MLWFAWNWKGRVGGNAGVLGLVNTGTGWSVTLNGIPGVYRLGYHVEHNYMAWDLAMDVTQQQAIENIDYIEVESILSREGIMDDIGLSTSITL